MKVILAAALTLLLTVGAVPAMADTSTSNFEPPAYTVGTVNGQNGWTVDPIFDEGVVANGASVPAAFGQQSWRLSNAVTSGGFAGQPVSPAVTAPAGEELANKVFTSQFSFLSTTPGAVQPGLVLSMSPDSGQGSRMSYVRLEDSANGIQVFFRDVPTGYVNADHSVLFSEQQIATLDRAVPHTIRFDIKLVPGQDNDVVRVYVDGLERVCGTTWENYYRYDAEQAPANTVPAIDEMLFRSAGTAAPALLNQGFLFDNVTVTTTNTGGPVPCETPAGLPGPPGPPGPPGAGPGSRIVAVLVGNTRRVLHAQKRKHMKFLRARATLRNKRLPVRGRRIIVDLRGKDVGNYNVYITAKYRTRKGKVKTFREMRALSVSRSPRDILMPG
jgi:hypothetical protein